MKLRLGMVLACTALLSGCPDAVNDQVTARGADGDPTMVAELDPAKFVCTNYRPWREDLDLPAYLSQEFKTDDGEMRENPEFTQRDKRKKEYIQAHEGSYTICHQPLVEIDLNAGGGSGRGKCQVCTDMLKNPAYQDKRIRSAYDLGTKAPKNPGLTANGSPYDADDPIKLAEEQQFTDKIEFRLKYVKDDYLSKKDEQKESFRQWISSRKPGKIVTGYDTSKQPAEPICETDPTRIVEEYVKRAEGRGMFTKDDANPRVIPKFGLPPLAEPFIGCPRCAKPVYSTQSRCWNCNLFYVLSHRDERQAIAEPYESLCPNCNQPVDPTLNYCDNPTCRKCPTHGDKAKYTKDAQTGEYACSQCGYKVSGSFHRATDREGPCWRCGGSHVCPECLGSGKGHAPIEGEDNCWLCGGKGTQGAPGSNGACPECDARGFTTYDGALPASFKGDKRDWKKDWRLSKPGSKKAGEEGGSGGGEKGGDEKGGDEKGK